MEVAANHTEISLMKSQWVLICKKIAAIQANKCPINLQELIVGASIPYMIDIFKDLSSQQSPDFLPFFICMLLLFLSTLLKKFSSYFSDHSTENSLHLSDLTALIDEINEQSKTN